MALDTFVNDNNKSVTDDDSSVKSPISAAAKKIDNYINEVDKKGSYNTLFV